MRDEKVKKKWIGESERRERERNTSVFSTHRPKRIFGVQEICLPPPSPLPFLASTFHRMNSRWTQYAAEVLFSISSIHVSNRSRMICHDCENVAAIATIWHVDSIIIINMQTIILETRCVWWMCDDQMASAKCTVNCHQRPHDITQTYICQSWCVFAIFTHRTGGNPITCRSMRPSGCSFYPFGMCIVHRISSRSNGCMWLKAVPHDNCTQIISLNYLIKCVDDYDHNYGRCQCSGNRLSSFHSNFVNRLWARSDY